MCLRRTVQWEDWEGALHLTTCPVWIFRRWQGSSASLDSAVFSQQDGSAGTSGSSSLTPPSSSLSQLCNFTFVFVPSFVIRLGRTPEAWDS